MGEALRPWLSEDEVVELTKRRRPHAQIKQLRSLGMSDFVRVRTDGTFVVLREMVAKSKTAVHALKLENLGRGA
jgi:hypothetical protein